MIVIAPLHAVEAYAVMAYDYLDTWATIKLHSHRYMIVPGCWPNSYEPCDDWYAELVVYNTIAVLVCIEFLKCKPISKYSKILSGIIRVM